MVSPTQQESKMPPADAAGFTELTKKRFAAAAHTKLNLACGAHPLDGWTNIDCGDGFFDAPAKENVFNLDVFEALALLPPDSVDFITSEQFFEHFTRQDGLRLMRACLRVLKKGGVMRVQVPDLELTVALYRNEVAFADWETVQLPHRHRHIRGSRDPYCKLEEGEAYTPAMMVNNSFHMDGHKFIYDYQTLAQSLRVAGFLSVEKVNYGESRHTELAGIDRHDGGTTGRHWIPKIALCAEATK